MFVKFIHVIAFFTINMAILCPQLSFAKQCTGHFVNPIKDICWKCLFPLSIGNIPILAGPKLNPNDLKPLIDTINSSGAKITSPITMCPSGRIGLNIGYWEPIALVDITDNPYCFVNLGGMKLNLGFKQGRGGRQTISPGETDAFYHVHWYKYPLIVWLNIITSAGCQQGGDFDIAYLSELDPTWKDSEMSFIFNPEAVLFGNPIAQAACAADSIASTVARFPLDFLFWCAGSQGSHYPLSGHVNSPVSPVQTALLLAERANFKLHRLRLITDSSPKLGEICNPKHHYPVTPKSRYRYEMVNQVADGRHCYPSGFSTLMWEAGKIKPHTQEQYGFLVWRKRNCVFL